MSEVDVKPFASDECFHGAPDIEMCSKCERGGCRWNEGDGCDCWPNESFPHPEPKDQAKLRAEIEAEFGPVGLTPEQVAAATDALKNLHLPSSRPSTPEPPKERA